MRPGRFELPTCGFEVRCSIQLSYGRSPVQFNIWSDKPTMAKHIGVE